MPKTNNMKNLLTIFLTSALWCNAQPFIGFKYSNIGFGAEIGYLSEQGIQLSASYQLPVLDAEKPSIGAFTLGKLIEVGKYNLTPIAGIAFTKQTHFDDKDFRTDTRGTKPIYSLEFCRQWHRGRLYLSGSYAGLFYYGMGIKAFL